MPRRSLRSSRWMQKGCHKSVTKQPEAHFRVLIPMFASVARDDGCLREIDLLLEELDAQHQVQLPRSAIVAGDRMDRCNQPA